MLRRIELKTAACWVSAVTRVLLGGQPPAVVLPVENQPTPKMVVPYRVGALALATLRAHPTPEIKINLHSQIVHL